MVLISVSLSYGERILVVGSQNLSAYANAIGTPHTFTTISTAAFSSSDIDIMKHDQIWLMNWSSDALPTVTLSPYLQNFLKVGGKVALFTDAHIVWDASLQVVTNFVNSVVKTPTFALVQGPEGFYEMDSVGALQADPTSAALFAGKQFEFSSVACASGTALAGGIPILQSVTNPTQKSCVVFDKSNLKSEYSSGRLTVFGDIGYALTSATVDGNKNILKFIASFITAATSGVTITPTVVAEEPNETKSFTVSLGNAVDEAVTINYEIKTLGTGAGFAISNADYSGTLSGSLTFAKGETQKTFVLNIINDSDYEIDEIFGVTLSSSSSAILLAGTGKEDVIITIESDDPDNHAPTNITLNPSPATIKENAPTGSLIGTLSTFDIDAGNTFIYSLTDDAGGAFTLTGDKIYSGRHFDFEKSADRSFTIAVSTTDNMGASIVSPKQFTITVLPVNDSTAKGFKDTYSVSENTVLTKDSLSGLLVNDTDGDSITANTILKAYKKTDPLYGSVVINQNGSFTYTQTAGLEMAVDSFSYTITDSATYDNVPHVGTVASWAVISILPVDDNTPTAQGASRTIYENEKATIDVTSLIADLDGTPLTVAVASQGTQGTVSVAGKVFTYSHDGSKESPFSDSFTYTAISEDKTSLPATVTVTINPVNDTVSVATDNSYSTTEGGTIAGNVITDNVADSDKDELSGNNILTSFISGSAPAHHTGSPFSLNKDGSFTYKNDGTPGTFTFQYSLRDSTTYQYGNSYDRVNSSNSATVTITVAAENSSTPVAGSTFTTVKENSSVEIDVASLISDADIGKPGLTEKLTILPLTPKEGTVSLKSGSETIVVYTHGKGDITRETFIDTVFYEVSDMVNHKDTGSIAITITKLNDNKPVVKQDTITVPFGKKSTITIPAISDADLPADQNIAGIDSTIQNGGGKGVVVSSHEGSLSWQSTNSFGYVPNIASSAVIDSFEYQILDSVAYDAANVHRVTAWMYIKLDQSSKDLPIAGDTTLVLNEGDSIVSFDLMTLCAKGKVGADLDYITIVTDPTLHKGTFSVTSNGIFTYRHNDSENFTDQFTYTGTDKTAGKALVSAEGKITFTINPLNDNKPSAPTITTSVNEGSSVAINTKTGLSDTAETDVQTSWSVAIKGINGGAKFADSVTIDSISGNLTYFHNGNEPTVDDTIIVTVSDVTPYDTANIHSTERTIIISIKSINDNKPEAKDSSITVKENGTVTIDVTSLVSDIDGGTFTFGLESSSTKMGQVSHNGSTFTYVHNGKGTEQFSDLFTYTVTDTKDASGNQFTSKGTITVTVIPQNDEIASNLPETFTVAENKTLDTAIAVASIADNDRHTTITASPYGNLFRFELKDSTTNGIVTLNNATGAFQYTPSNMGTEFSADSFTYVIVDSVSYGDTTTHRSLPILVKIEILDVNDETPIALEDTIIVPEGESTTVLKNGENSVLGNDSDRDANSTLTAILAGSPVNGTMVLSANGTFNYQHNGTATTVDSLFYVASDGLYKSDTVKVAVLITAKPPVLDSAFYFDADANGSIDSAVLYFNHAINPAATGFGMAWESDNSPVSVNQAVNGTAGNEVILALSGSVSYRTSGSLTATISHTNFGNSQATGIISDRAAPVVTQAVYSAKSDIGGDLSISLSENMIGIFAEPFRLITGTDSLDLNLGNYTASGTTYTYAVPFSVQTFSEQDSICINPNANITDANNAVQANPSNIRQPIIIGNRAISAAYHDTDAVADGRIDKISVTTALALDQKMLDMIELGSDTMIVLNNVRMFKIEDFKLNEKGFDIIVSEKSDVTNTAVTGEDRLFINGSVTYDNNSFVGDTLDIIDSVAPIILNGIYGTDGTDTILTLNFSEPVNAIAADTTGKPFGFYDASTGAPFTMSLSFVSVDSKTATFTVKNLSIDYLVSGDSVNIQTALSVFDKNGIAQIKSIWAPIVTSIEYAMDLQLLIFPQPLVIEKEESGKTTPALLSPLMRDHYNFSTYGITTENGVAFVLETSGPLSPEGNHIATAQLLDQTGNIVSDKIPFIFVTKDGGNLAGVAVWDGKNKSGRTVGAGSYLLAVEASVETDEGANSRVIQKSVLKTVGVKMK